MAGPAGGGTGAANPPTAMTDEQRSLLWQQRVFEAEAGMTNYLARRHGGAGLPEWMQVKATIYRGLPEAGSGDHRAWQRVFFRAQALMERFLVNRYGHGELGEWARFNAEVHSAVEPDRGGGAADVVDRIARQAELYSSVYRVEELTPSSAQLLISHCAIWDYREQARRRGVPITLDSPCEYCTGATASNISARGYRAEYELLDNGADRGCRWRVRTPAAGAGPVETSRRDR